VQSTAGDAGLLMTLICCPTSALLFVLMWQLIGKDKRDSRILQIYVVVLNIIAVTNTAWRIVFALFVIRNDRDMTNDQVCIKSSYCSLIDARGLTLVACRIDIRHGNFQCYAHRHGPIVLSVSMLEDVGKKILGDLAPCNHLDPDNSVWFNLCECKVTLQPFWLLTGARYVGYRSFEKVNSRFKPPSHALADSDFSNSLYWPVRYLPHLLSDLWRSN
jgi:hypothetical protein